MTYSRERQIQHEIETTLRFIARCEERGLKIPGGRNADFGERQPPAVLGAVVDVCLYAPPPYPQRPLKER